MKDDFWILIAAAFAGGAVSQIRRKDPIPWYWRIGHLMAGAACAYFATPWVVDYFHVIDQQKQYLIPFGIGIFWIKVFDAFDNAIGSIKIPMPWGK